MSTAEPHAVSNHLLRCNFACVRKDFARGAPTNHANNSKHRFTVMVVVTVTLLLLLPAFSLAQDPRSVEDEGGHCQFHDPLCGLTRKTPANTQPRSEDRRSADRASSSEDRARRAALRERYGVVSADAKHRSEGSQFGWEPLPATGQQPISVPDRRKTRPPKLASNESMTQSETASAIGWEYSFQADILMAPNSSSIRVRARQQEPPAIGCLDPVLPTSSKLYPFNAALGPTEGWVQAIRQAFAATLACLDPCRTPRDIEFLVSCTNWNEMNTSDDGRFERSYRWDLEGLERQDFTCGRRETILAMLGGRYERRNYDIETAECRPTALPAEKFEQVLFGNAAAPLQVAQAVPTSGANAAAPLQVAQAVPTSGREVDEYVPPDVAHRSDLVLLVDNSNSMRHDSGGERIVQKIIPRTITKLAAMNVTDISVVLLTQHLVQTPVILDVRDGRFDMRVADFLRAAYERENDPNERPLAALAKQLPGRVRPDASVSIIVLTDEEDSSPQGVEAYRSILSRLTSHRVTVSSTQPTNPNLPATTPAFNGRWALRNMARLTSGRTWDLYDQQLAEKIASLVMQSQSIELALGAPVERVLQVFRGNIALGAAEFRLDHQRSTLVLSGNDVGTERYRVVYRSHGQVIFEEFTPRPRAESLAGGSGRGPLVVYSDSERDIVARTGMRARLQFVRAKASGTKDPVAEDAQLLVPDAVIENDRWIPPVDATMPDAPYRVTLTIRHHWDFIDLDSVRIAYRGNSIPAESMRETANALLVSVIIPRSQLGGIVEVHYEGTKFDYKILESRNSFNPRIPLAPVDPAEDDWRAILRDSLRDTMSVRQFETVLESTLIEGSEWRLGGTLKNLRTELLVDLFLRVDARLLRRIVARLSKVDGGLDPTAVAFLRQLAIGDSCEDPQARGVAAQRGASTLRTTDGNPNATIAAALAEAVNRRSVLRSLTCSSLAGTMGVELEQLTRELPDLRPEMLARHMSSWLGNKEYIEGMGEDPFQLAADAIVVATTHALEIFSTVLQRSHRTDYRHLSRLFKAIVRNERQFLARQDCGSPANDSTLTSPLGALQAAATTEDVQRLYRAVVSGAQLRRAAVVGACLELAGSGQPASTTLITPSFQASL